MVADDQPSDDVLDQELKLLFLRGVRGEHRRLALGRPDDGHAQRVEGPRVHRQARPLLDPIRHLLCGLGGVGHQHDLARQAEAACDQMSRLGDDYAGLTRAGSRQDQVGVLVGDNGQPLFGRQRVLFDGVEQALRANELGLDERFGSLGAVCARRLQECVDRIQGALVFFGEQTDGEGAREAVHRLAGVPEQRFHDAGGGVSLGRSQLPDGFRRTPDILPLRGEQALEVAPPGPVGLLGEAIGLGLVDADDLYGGAVLQHDREAAEE